MSKIPLITTVVALVFTVLFTVLNRFWAGFVYFVLACLFLLSMFWGVWLIYLYFTEYKNELEEKFKIHKAHKVNDAGITSEFYDENIAVFRKEFNRMMIKEKIVKWAMILFCFAVAVAFLIGMIYYHI
ncbi:MAG: hypothetical protein J6K39_00535 [Clostridia bacterium]|nr:hypothetical protein [Clostridia bacterium]